MTDDPDVPSLAEARQRLVRRFGDAVQPWLAALPSRLHVLRERWHLDLDNVIPKGSMSVVIHCRTEQGQRAVLKISPERDRVAQEIAALTHWAPPHVPTILQADPELGVLLLEAIAPGMPLQDGGTYPALREVAQLLTALHTPGSPDRVLLSVADRVAALFASWARVRQQDPTLVAVVPEALFERGRRMALRLAAAPAPTMLLHGDLTPVNLLDGGARRGLVAIDPAPCLGDPAFDAIDLLFWQADDLYTIRRRAAVLAPAIGLDATRLLAWCTAFAGMAALDLVGPGQRAEPPDATRRERVSALLNLAAQAPSR